MPENAINYVPVRVSTLRGDQKIAFDIFIQLNSKYILYIRQGDSFEGKRLDRLRERKLKKMFIRPEDEAQYRQYLQLNIEMAYDAKSKQTIENRSQVVQGLQQASTEAVFENPEDVGAYNAAKDGSQKFADFLMKEDQALKAMMAIENTDQNLAHHGVAVATLAMGIAKYTKFEDVRNLHLLTLGALLHDIAHYKSGLNVARPISEFTPQEMALYKEHPHEGARMVKDLAHMDQHVTQIIHEHEEHADGSGFPRKKIEKNMNPLSVLVASANAYDRLIAFERMKPADALKKLFVEKIGRHPLSHLNALKLIVGS